MHTNSKDRIIQQLVSLGDRYDNIRAMILFSSRTEPSNECDVFSDYDIEIFAENPARMGESDEWFEEFGPVLIVYREEPSERYKGYTRLVIYEDGVKIDFGIAHPDTLKRFEDALPPYFDTGYEVLLDKDGVTNVLQKPSYKAFIPLVPTETEYLAAVNEFWFNSTYASKYLWRDDVMPAQFMLVRWLKGSDLRRMLEWYIEIDKNWSWKPGHTGKNMKKVLDSDTYRELVESYAGGDINELWESLFRTIALFRRIAIIVAKNLGYTYPHKLDERLMNYHHAIRNLDRHANSREELSNLLMQEYR